MKKKSLVLIATVVMMMAALVVGGTLAYFTDTDSATNTFEAGKVGISLDEAVVVADDKDNLVADGDKRTSDVQNYKLHPGQVVTKDPTIYVDEDSLDAYVGAMVKVKGDLYDLIGVEGYDTINIHALASGGMLADNEGAYGDYNGLFVFQNDNYAIHQQVIKAENPADNVWVMYIFLKAPKAAGSETVLFDTLTVPASYDNAEMAKLDTMQIDVTAFATQTEGFADCYEALTSAFPDQFKFN